MTAFASDKEFKAALSSLSAARQRHVGALDSYTVCGSNTDWLRQAGHFVATAGAACLVTDGSEEQCRSIAWTAAVNARMARNCQLIAKGEESNDAEAKAQYGILAQALAD